jgi:hypothetical protein
MVNVVQGIFLIVILLVIASAVFNSVLTFINLKLYTEFVKMRQSDGNKQPAHSDEKLSGAGGDVPADRGQSKGRNR